MTNIYIDTCEFSYVSQSDSQPKHAVGIERSWDELKAEFGRNGPGYPGAIYFKTISTDGPQLFAVLNDNTVFYHNHDKWYCYVTAKDIKFGMLRTADNNPARATDDIDRPRDREWSITHCDKELAFDDDD